MKKKQLLNMRRIPETRESTAERDRAAYPPGLRGRSRTRREEVAGREELVRGAREGALRARQRGKVAEEGVTRRWDVKTEEYRVR